MGGVIRPIPAETASERIQIDGERELPVEARYGRRETITVIVTDPMPRLGELLPQKRRAIRWLHLDTRERRHPSDQTTRLIGR
jgi:hypothetical protein